MLTACPECSRSVSDKAAQCPHCGVGFVKKSGGAFRPLVIVLLAGILFVMLAVVGFFILVMETALSGSQ
jgi:uncharacterized paraquat-inducible protein A